MDVLKTYDLPFAVETVYAAWVSSGTVIPPATAMDIDPVVDGHYRLLMDTPDGSWRNEGRFLEVEPGRRVKYTWEWNGDGEVTEIAVDFEPSETGATVRIAHTGFAGEDSARMHDAGWDSYIEGFKAHLAGI